VNQATIYQALGGEARAPRPQAIGSE
jgi:hypothetical protein